MRTSNPGKNRQVFRTGVMTLFVVLAAALVHPVFAQTTRIDSGTVSQSKFGFYFETHLEPGTPPMSDFVGQTTDEPGVIHRALLDRTGRVYAGYDVIVEVLAEPNTYRVSFRRLAMTPEIARRFTWDNPDAWRQLPTTGWNNSAPRDIRGGDVIGLRLFENPVTKQAVVDYVTIQEPSRKFSGFNPTPERQFAFAPGSSRDFKVDDVDLTIASPRLSVNGKQDESSTKRYDEVAGAVVWIYVPRRGRYILSLVPHPELGFRKAGEVRGSSLSFVVGNETFELNTGRRIAPGSAPYNLYVLHQPDWKPTYANADLSVFNMGAAERAESLVRR